MTAGAAMSIARGIIAGGIAESPAADVAGAWDRAAAGAAAMASDAAGGVGRRRHILDLDDFGAGGVEGVSVVGRDGGQ